MKRTGELAVADQGFQGTHLVGHLSLKALGFLEQVGGGRPGGGVAAVFNEAFQVLEAAGNRGQGLFRKGRDGGKVFAGGCRESLELCFEGGRYRLRVIRKPVKDSTAATRGSAVAVK